MKSLKQSKFCCLGPSGGGTGGVGAKWQRFWLCSWVCAPDLVSKDMWRVKLGILSSDGNDRFFGSPPSFTSGIGKITRTTQQPSCSSAGSREAGQADSVPQTLASASNPHALPGARFLLGPPLLVAQSAGQCQLEND